MSPNTLTLECRPTLDEAAVHALRAGDAVRLSGELLTIRDATAKRLVELARDGQPLPVELAGRLLYAVGPSPPKPGHVIGSAGPTTAERFVTYLPLFLEQGLRGFLAKGELHGDIVRTFGQFGAVYLAAIGGLGALLGKCVESVDVAAFPELGPEALMRLRVRDFPAVVIIDRHGRNLHDTARAAWRRSPAT